MYKKGDARAKLSFSVLFCHSKPIDVLPFSLPSPLSLVKFPLSSGLCFQTTGPRVDRRDLYQFLFNEPALIPAKEDEV